LGPNTLQLDRTPPPNQRPPAPRAQAQPGQPHQAGGLGRAAGARQQQQCWLRRNQPAPGSGRRRSRGGYGVQLWPGALHTQQAHGHHPAPPCRAEDWAGQKQGQAGGKQAIEPQPQPAGVKRRSRAGEWRPAAASARTTYEAGPGPGSQRARPAAQRSECRLAREPAPSRQQARSRIQADAPGQHPGISPLSPAGAPSRVADRRREASGSVARAMRAAWRKVREHAVAVVFEVSGWVPAGSPPWHTALPWRGTFLKQVHRCCKRRLQVPARARNSGSRAWERPFILPTGQR